MLKKQLQKVPWLDNAILQIQVYCIFSSSFTAVCECVCGCMGTLTHREVGNPFYIIYFLKFAKQCERAREARELC